MLGRDARRAHHASQELTGCDHDAGLDRGVVNRVVGHVKAGFVFFEPEFICFPDQRPVRSRLTITDREITNESGFIDSPPPVFKYDMIEVRILGPYFVLAVLAKPNTMLRQEGL